MAKEKKAENRRQHSWARRVWQGLNTMCWLHNCNFNVGSPKKCNSLGVTTAPKGAVPCVWVHTTRSAGNALHPSYHFFAALPPPGSSFSHVGISFHSFRVLWALKHAALVIVAGRQAAKGKQQALPLFQSDFPLCHGRVRLCSAAHTCANCRKQLTGTRNYLYLTQCRLSINCSQRLRLFRLSF